MAGGRPKKFETVEQLEVLIEGYFDYCDNYIATKITFDKEGEQVLTKVHKPKPYTVQGLAVYLDCSTETLRLYEQQDGFFATIKRAKTKIEANKVEGMLTGELNATGVIFDLKNNHDWKDKTEADLNHSGGTNNKITVEIIESNTSNKDN